MKTQKTLFSLVIGIFSINALYFILTKLGYIMPISEFKSVFCGDACQLEKPIHFISKSEELLNTNQPLTKLLKGDINKDKVSILVEKSKYRLTVFYNLQPIKSYRVVFGSSPSGDKLNEGDKKTPEGIYHLRDAYPHPQWSKFMWLNYPTSQSWRNHFQAKSTGKINWLLPIGGDVGIHGVPKGQDSFIDKRYNWTLGCISLKNKDVNEVYQYVKIGTLVEIVIK